MGETHGAASEDVEGWRDVDAWLASLKPLLAECDPIGIEESLAFLERDPYFHRSGYAREKIARWLAQVSLTPTQRDRARAIVLSTVDGERHCPQRGVGRLARAVADNELRRQLRRRLHDPRADVSWRALRMMESVRRPGLTPNDLEIARALILAHAGRGLWLSPTVERLALRLWSSDWERVLRALIPVHGPDRAAAKRLLGPIDRRRERRPGP